MKKFPEPDPDNSIIRSRVADYQELTKALFEWVYPWFSEGEEFDHPPIQLRYMIDDYWELMVKENLNEG